eukprot:81763_1
MMNSNSGVYGNGDNNNQHFGNGDQFVMKQKYKHRARGEHHSKRLRQRLRQRFPNGIQNEIQIEGYPYDYYNQYTAMQPPIDPYRDLLNGSPRFETFNHSPTDFYPQISYANSQQIENEPPKKMRKVQNENK